MTPAGLRSAVAAALAPLDEDWTVHEGPVDAISPPALMLVWADPWITPATACWYTARLNVIAVAARIDPEPGYRDLERLVGATVRALQANPVGFVQVGGPGRFEIGNVVYQAARITVAGPVSLEEE